MREINPENFWSKVEKSSDPDGCWMWKGGRSSSGYGNIFGWVDGKKTTYKAHNYSFWLHNGYLTPGLQRLHSCDTPLCVAPHHLSEGTALENNQDMMAKGRNRQPKQEAHPKAILNWAEVNYLRERYATGTFTQVELARKLHLDNTTVQKIVTNQLWYDPNYQEPTFDRTHAGATKMTWEKAAQVRFDYATGLKNGQLAKKYGISAAMVTALVANTRWTDPEYTPPAPKTVSERYAKLTPDQVQEIRSRYAAGARLIDLANEFKVNDTNIIAIVKRKSWKDVA